MTTDRQEARADPTTEDLRLAVVDTEDLAVVSAHLQDSEVTLGDMTYLARSKRFALVVSRFDWTLAAAGRFERCQTGLHFERVLKVASHGLDLGDTTTSRRLLAISFWPDDPPSGNVLLTFAGDGQIRLTVEVLEAELRDLGPRWTVDGRPGHSLDEGQAQGL